MTKRTRANNAEIAARVHEIMTCRLNGASFCDLQALAHSKAWNVSDRQLWRYVQLADQEMERHFDEDRETIFRRHILQRRRLYALSVQDGDYRTALAILRDESALFSLYGEAQAGQTVIEHASYEGQRQMFAELGRILNAWPEAKIAVAHWLETKIAPALENGRAG